ncbi:MAG: hypothetical protein DIU78_014735 [Pseudomonadota bacterium]
MRALPEETLRKVTVDVPTVVATILGALPKVRVYRAQIVDELPKYDLGPFDRLEEYALALAYAHGAYVAASQPPRSLEEVGAEASRVREIMLADAEALAVRGLIDRSRLAEIRLGSGYRDTAFDLVALVNLYRSRWSHIESRTGVMLGELEMAEIVADRLIIAVGERDQIPVKRSAAIDDRMRAFTLCVNAYNQVRRAIGYLRFDHNDADLIAPSLYAGRIRRVEDDEAAGSDPTPIESGISPLPSEATNVPPEVRAGLPGGSPFTE